MVNIDKSLPLTGKEPPPGWRRRVDGLSAFYHGVWDKNIHPNCLHLFCCLDGDPLPDFTGGMGTI
jgi:hypothetical protein